MEMQGMRKAVARAGGARRLNNPFTNVGENGLWASRTGSAQPTRQDRGESPAGCRCIRPRRSAMNAGTWQGHCLPKDRPAPQASMCGLCSRFPDRCRGLEGCVVQLDQGGQPAPISRQLSVPCAEFTVLVVPAALKAPMSRGRQGDSEPGWRQDTDPHGSVSGQRPTRPGRFLNRRSRWGGRNPSFEVATSSPAIPTPGRDFLWRGNRFLTYNTH